MKHLTYEYYVWHNGNLVFSSYVCNPDNFFESLCLRALQNPKGIRSLYGVIRFSHGVPVISVSVQSLIQGVRKLIRKFPAHCFISGSEANDTLEYTYRHLKNIKHGRKEVLFNEWKRMADF